MNAMTVPMKGVAVTMRRFGGWLSRRGTTKQNVMQAVGLAAVLTIILTLLGAVIEPDVAINWWEVAAVGFSFASTWLCVKQSRTNYVFGVIATMLLSYVFWSSGLLGSMALNLYLIPTLVYGWFVWGRDTQTKPVEHVKVRVLPLYVIATVLTWAGAAFLITQLGGELSMLDGWLLVGSVLAQYLLDRKKIETWMVWIAVNVVSVYVYFTSGLVILALQFLLFLINAIFAYFVWRKSMKATQAQQASDERGTPHPSASATDTNTNVDPADLKNIQESGEETT